MTERPQVLTLTAGGATVHLDTATVARACVGLRYGIPASVTADILALVDALTTVCGADHLTALTLTPPDNAPTP